MVTTTSSSEITVALDSPSANCLDSNDASTARLVYPWKPDTEGQGPANTLRKTLLRSATRTREAFGSWGWLEWLSFFLPCIGWLRTYKWRLWLKDDVVAGVSVGFMAIPQGLSYANLAALPSVYGLYGCFLPCLVYCLFGSSRQLSVGPVAVTSLLLAANLQALLPCSQHIASPNTPATPEDQACQAQYNQAAVQVCLVVAVLYTAMGVLRVGWVTKFLSHAVIGGFTTGAAITIGVGQAKYILGFPIVMGSSTRLQDYLTQYFNNLHNLRWQEYVMGITFIFLLVALRESHRLWRPLRHLRSLGALIVCILGILTVVLGQVNTPDRGSIRTVGFITPGLPPWTGNLWLPIEDPSLGELLPTCLIILVVALLESTSIARALARKNGYELVYNREIVGLGLANLAGAMSSAYTTTGSFSRSAVNNNAGAKSPLAQFVCGWLVGIVLISLTSVFAKVPFNAMAAIVIVSIASLIEYEQAIYLWKVNKLDLACFLASCFGTLFFSIEVGLGVAIGLAILVTVHQSAFPHTAVLGKVPGSNYVYRNVKQYPDSQVYPGVLGFRIDAPLYFANVNSVEDKLEKAMVKAAAWSEVQGVPKLLYVVLDLTPVHHVDSMGLHFLEDLIFETTRKGVQLLLANPNKNVVRDWERVKLPDLLGREYVFVSVHEATIFALRRMCELGYDIVPLALPTSSSLPGFSLFGSASTSSRAASTAGLAPGPVHAHAAAECLGPEGGGPSSSSSSMPSTALASEDGAQKPQANGRGGLGAKDGKGRKPGEVKDV